MTPPPRPDVRQWLVAHQDGNAGFGRWQRGRAKARNPAPVLPCDGLSARNWNCDQELV